MNDTPNEKIPGQPLEESLRDLDPPPEVKLQLLDAIARRVVDHVASLPDQPTQATENGADAASWLPDGPPESGAPLEDILDLLFERVIPCSFNTASPGYFAYVPGGGLYTAAAAEFLAAAVNRYAGVWAAAPGPVELETQVLRWLAELMGLPAGSLGVITSGGSLSNLLAVVAAREKLVGETFTTATVYVSNEVHHSVSRAARIAGIPRSNVRSIPVDDSFRMRCDLLEARIAEDRRQGLEPFFVCGSAGTVNTGAIDPLDAIARIAERHGLWFHVDGAYGGIFRIVPELADAFVGMEQAHSLAVDPHKGLFLPYGTGVLLVRDLADLKRAFESSAAYLPQIQGNGGDRVDFCEVSPELSRDWRGLRIWLPFVLHGVDAFRSALRQKRELAERAWRRLAAEPDLEVAAPPELSLFAFRRRFPGVDREEENRRNRTLLDRINSRRRVFLTGTEIDGRFFLRLCVLHLRTDRSRLDEAVDAIVGAAG